MVTVRNSSGKIVSWMHKTEMDALAKIAKDIEHTLIFGDSETKRKKAREAVTLLLLDKLVTTKESKRIMAMIDSPAEDDLQFAETLIETIIEKHVSNISITESQVPELRS
jgi:hypothetical protein